MTTNMLLHGNKKYTFCFALLHWKQSWLGTIIYVSIFFICMDPSTLSFENFLIYATFLSFQLFSSLVFQLSNEYKNTAIVSLTIKFQGVGPLCLLTDLAWTSLKF